MFVLNCVRRIFTGAWDDDRSRRPADCVFCAIAEERPVGGVVKELIYKDADIVAFKDRSPAAYVHYLVCPRDHIASVRQLQPGPADAALAARMLDVGKQLVASAAPGRETQFGYHVPPFNSVNHLHLHCFALPFTPCWKSLKYVPAPIGLDFTYMSAENLQQRLGGSSASHRERLAEEGGGAGPSGPSGSAAAPAGGGGGGSTLTTSLLPKTGKRGSSGGGGEATPTAGGQRSPPAAGSGGGYGAFSSGAAGGRSDDAGGSTAGRRDEKRVL